MRIVFADSVLPVESQIQLYSGDCQLSESLWLRPASGHTPGSSVLWLDAGAPAVFVGDLTHCPIQLPRPDDACVFDEDPLAATVTRKRVLTEASRRRAATTPAPAARASWPAATRSWSTTGWNSPRSSEFGVVGQRESGKGHRNH